MNPQKKATIIGVLMDLGADRRGVDMGPSAVRVAGLNERFSTLVRRRSFWAEIIPSPLAASADCRRSITNAASGSALYGLTRTAI